METEPTMPEPPTNESARQNRNRERVLYGLSLDYTIAFVLDLETDGYEIAFSQATNHAQKNELSKFTAYVARYADAFVVPDQRETFEHELNHLTIRERLEKRNEYHYSFETVPNAAGLSFFQAHIVKEFDEYGHFAFLGFRSVDDIVKRERFYQEQLEAANRELERQLDLITDALPGGVKISNDDETYSFKYVSEQFAAMLGYDSPEQLAASCDNSVLGLAHPDDIETGLADALAQYEVQDHYATTYRVRCHDGSYKYIEDRGRKFIEPDGTVEHWNLFLDKNELMEKTIALATEQRASKAKSDFLSRMSHDMRTPLNGIIGLLDICARHPEDQELVDTSRGKAMVAANHLLSLINDTLELSKLESKDVTLHEETFATRDLQHEIGTIAKMRAEEEGIPIEFRNYGELTHYHLVGSPLYVKQIVLNLINNAIRYNREGGSVLCAATELPLDEGRCALRFTVSDTGIGMSEEFLANIFKPFVQADDSVRSTYRGTGLGMAIVKNLVDRMAGTIDIQSKEGQGTIVTVTLPFTIADEESIADASAELDRSRLKGLHVLLAEDNDLNRELASFMLEDAGIIVTEVADGKEALDRYMEMPAGYFDAIVMDIMMPEMDGYEATRAIRACGKADAVDIPIIAMTAYAFDDDRAKSAAAGMDLHLPKPMSSRELLAAIAGLVSR